MSDSIKSPLKAIKAHCLECICGTIYDVKQCTAKNCNLYPFRLGKNPNIKRRKYTEEERKTIAERLKKYRDQRTKDESNV